MIPFQTVNLLGVRSFVRSFIPLFVGGFFSSVGSNSNIDDIFQ